MFNPVYNAEKVTSSEFRIYYNDTSHVTTALDKTRTKSVIVYIDEVQTIASTHYDNNTYYFDTYAIKTQQLSRSKIGEPINGFRMTDYTHYAGSKITIWGCK